MAAKLSDLQLVLLSTAAQRPDGSLLPPPETVEGQMARIRKAIPPLLKRELIEEAPVTDAAQVWREDGEARIGLVITAAGRTTIGAEQPVREQTADAPPAEVAASPAKASTNARRAPPTSSASGTKAGRRLPTSTAMAAIPEARSSGLH